MVDFAQTEAFFEGHEGAAALDTWRADFALSDPAAHADAFATFVSLGAIAAACERIDIEGDMLEALLEGARAIEADAVLKRLAWHCHYMLFLSGADQVIGPVWTWPQKLPDVGIGARMFYPIVQLSGFDHVRKLHAARDIPEAITWHTLSDVRIWIRDDTEAGNGVWQSANMGWLSLHMQGQIYRLGRLQFELNTLKQPLVALRNRADNSVVILAGAGETFRSDGQYANADGTDATEGCFTTTLDESNSAITGHVIDTSASAAREPATFSLDDWDVVLRPGDPLLYFHIPKDGRMDHQACGESFEWSTTFFPRHFPEHDFKAYYTTSWLLDPQLGEHLDDDSNIVRFLREFHPLPRPKASDTQTMERVFGSKPTDWSAAPRDTSLRRAIIDHVQAGGVWRDGACLLLRDDLDWGSQVYRSKAGG